MLVLGLEVVWRRSGGLVWGLGLGKGIVGAPVGDEVGGLASALLPCWRACCWGEAAPGGGQVEGRTRVVGTGGCAPVLVDCLPAVASEEGA